MFKDFVVNKRAFSKMADQIVSILIYYVHPHGTFPTILLQFSLNTSHHLHLKYINYYCDNVIFIVLLWCVPKYLLLWRKEYLSYSFSEERCIFSMRSFGINKLMQKYHILPNPKGTVRQIKKTTKRWSLQQENKSWNCRISFN